MAFLPVPPAFPPRNSHAKKRTAQAAKDILDIFSVLSQPGTPSPQPSTSTWTTSAPPAEETTATPEGK